MKKLFLYLFVLFVFTSCASLLNLDGNKFYVDGVTYKLTEDKTSVFVVYDDRYNQQSEIYIPKEIVVKGKTYPVAFIDQDFFSRRPNGLKVVIEEYILKDEQDDILRRYHDVILRRYADLDITIKHLICSSSLSDIPYVKIESLTIPNSVTKIGYGAFSNCSGLTSVTIPNSVTRIGSNAFKGCSGLTSVTIPKSVTEIGDQAFAYCSGLTSVTIPNSVTTIGSYAFSGCSGLTSVTIPKSVTSSGSDAFSHCSGLTSVTWNAINFRNSYFDSPFRGLTGIKSFVFGNEVEHIPAYLCDGLTGLTSVTIPNSVTEIGERAFSGCSGLTSVTIGNSVTSIGEDAFKGCSGLTSVTIPNSVTRIGFSAFSNCSGLTSVTIPNSVTKIDGEAFRGCTGLTSVTIGNSVTTIGYEAFYGCRGLTSMVVESGNSKYDSRNNCNAIIETATNTLISGCKNTIIPNSVTSIGKYAFSGCSGLTSVTIPKSVTEIGDGAFAYTSELRDVTIMNPNTKIDYRAFFDSRYESVFKSGVYQKRQAEKEKQRVEELAALKKRIGVSVYNNLSKGIITRGMKLSAIEDYASIEPKPKGHYSILMEMKRRINDEKNYHVVFFYNSTPMRGYTIWTKNNIVTTVIQN